MGSMKDLLGDRPYPYSPGYVRESATSKAAAQDVRSTAGQMRTQIAGYIRAAVDGATCDEVEAALDLRHQTASARVRELVLSKEIRDTGRTRKTRSGSPARVYERMQR